MSPIESTLVIVKPDALEHHLELRIRNELQSEKLFIEEIGWFEFDLPLVQEFYQWGQVDYPQAIGEYLCAVPLLAWLAKGERAIEKALWVKQRLRKEFRAGRLRNLLHCSESSVEFEWEYKLVKARSTPMNERTKNQVEVILFRQESSGEFSFLMMRRSPQRGGFWQPVTGNVEVDESFEAAARREVREETGIVDILDLVDTGYSFEFHDNGMDQFERVFGAMVSPGQDVKLSSEHDELVWVGITEALDSYLKYPGNKEGLLRLSRKLAQGRG